MKDKNQMKQGRARHIGVKMCGATQICVCLRSGQHVVVPRGTAVSDVKGTGKVGQVGSEANQAPAEGSVSNPYFPHLLSLPTAVPSY